jgi:phosphoglycerate dehydrogenase-like enzyme
MAVRVGVDETIDQSLLEGFPNEVQIVRIPENPQRQYAIDFWIAAMPPRILRRQWPHLTGVKVIQAPWAGVDTLLNLFPRDVMLCDGRGVHEIPTAEWTLAVILAMQKCLPFFITMQGAAKWAQGQQAQQNDASLPTKIKDPPAPVRDVADTTILIVGYGSIGQAIEMRLTPFRAKFLRVARVQRDGVASVNQLDDLLGQADIVVLTAPLTSETRGLMNAPRIRKMKHGALLVNAARGPLVDTNALLQALQAKKISAALDVKDPEPLPADHPLWKAPNLLLTPHVGGDSENFMTRAFRLVREQVERFAKGEPLLNIVDGEY